MPIAVSRHKSRYAAVTALATAAALGLAVGGPAHAATAATHALAGTVPSWATAKADVGPAPSTTTATVDVYLTGRDPSGLTAYATAVSNPSSPLYEHYLTPAEQNARFGPTAAQLSAVRSWLTGAGLKVGATTEQYVTATGDPAALHAAFGTTLRDFSVSGHTYYAPQSSAVVPATVSADVLGVAGLDNAPHAAKSTAQPAVSVTQAGTAAAVRANAKQKTATATSSDAPPYVGLTPCATYYGQSGPTDLPKAYGHEQPSPVCGYTPNQIRGAYGVNRSGLTGKGVTVAVVDWYESPTLGADANTFAVDNGAPAYRPGQFKSVTDQAAWNSMDVCGTVADDQPEQSLDVQEVHTMAPGANIVYVGASSCEDTDLIAAEADIVDHHLADIVTDSWDEDLFDTNGNETPANIAAYTQVFEEGAIEGIGFNFASGDCSTDDPAIVANGLNCDPFSSEPQVTFPSSSPWVTAVGATAIGIGKANNYEFETGMGDSEAETTDGTTWSTLPGVFLFGSGGGTSDYFTQPWYQRGVVPKSLSNELLTGTKAAQPMREVPDVAMEGDLLAATMVGYTQVLPDGTTGFAEAGFGGTSIASPLFAGEQADAEQAQGRPIGFANPEIYLRDQVLGSGAFHDVTDHPGGTTQAMAIDLGPGPTGEEGLLFTVGADWTLHATRGYDDVTGVGSPNLGYLESFRR